jgi:CAAX prenyl protease-like protein
MFDYKLALVIFVFAIPGLCLTIPRFLRKLSGTVSAKLPADKKLPPLPVLVVVQIAQSLLLVGGFAFLGAFLAPRAGLSAPFFSAIAHGENIAGSLPEPAPVLLISFAGSAIFIVMYYLGFQRWLERKSALAMDELRNEIGIVSRLLYGGIVEEVIARWGVMSLFVWLFNFVPFLTGSAAIWVSIVVSGLLFGLGHTPSYLAAGCQKSVAFFTAEFVLNVWASLFFGYLFWKYGLLAAMVSHMIYHLVWYPIDLAVLNKRRVLAGHPSTAQFSGNLE